MNTSKVKGDVKKPFSSKKILLTLQRSPKSSQTKAVFSRIVSDNEKTFNAKLIDIKPNNWDIGFRRVRNLFLKEMHNLDEPKTVDILLPKITQVSTDNKISLDTKQNSILKSTLLSDFLRNRQRFCNSETEQLESGLETSKYSVSESNSNKHNRFVPNILRNTKVAENTFINNTGLCGFNSPISMKTSGTNEYSEDTKNLKRNRKQVLRPLETKRGNSKKNQTLHKKKKLNHSSPVTRKRRNPNKDRRSTIFRINASKNEHEECNQFTEMQLEKSDSTEKAPSDSTEQPPSDCIDCNNSDIVNCEVPPSSQNSPGKEEKENPCTYKLVKKIFDEFEVADYQDYIADEDLYFDVDEMDKLLSSAIDDSLKESITFCYNTKIVEHDVNGNDIDNYGSAPKNKTDRNKSKKNAVKCEIDEYHCHERGLLTETSGLDFNSNDSSSVTLNDDINYFLSDIELQTTGSEDCYTSFDHNPSVVPQLSLTNVASESETSEINFTMSLSTDQLNNQDFNCSATSLTVSNEVPDNVFNFASEEEVDNLESDDYLAKQVLSSASTIQNHLDTGNNYDNINYAVIEPLERFKNDFKLFNDHETTFNFSNDTNYMESAEPDIDQAVLNETTVYKDFTTSADNSVKFDDNYVLAEQSVNSEFNIEKVNSTEIPGPLRLDDIVINRSQPIPNDSLQTCDSNIFVIRPSLDVTNQVNKKRISTRSDFDFQFVNNKLENREDRRKKNGFRVHVRNSYATFLKSSISSDKVFKSKRLIQGNLNTKNQNKNRVATGIACPYSKRISKSDKGFAKHIKDDHPYRNSGSALKIKKYICDMCSKEYLIAGAIEKHLKLHEDYSLTCRICGKHFSEKKFLRFHINSSHFDWHLECTYCSRKFGQKNGLTRHLRKCHGEDPYVENNY